MVNQLEVVSCYIGEVGVGLWGGVDGSGMVQICDGEVQMDVCIFRESIGGGTVRGYLVGVGVGCGRVVVLVGWRVDGGVVVWVGGGCLEGECGGGCGFDGCGGEVGEWGWGFGVGWVRVGCGGLLGAGVGFVGWLVARVRQLMGGMGWVV
ncbi:hypothetical protein Tco_1155235 [Tanacetum coccineum]